MSLHNLQRSLGPSPSYVIVELETGAAVCETYQRSVAEAINHEKYRAVPIRDYLASINSRSIALPRPTT